MYSKEKDAGIINTEKRNHREQAKWKLLTLLFWSDSSLHFVLQPLLFTCLSKLAPLCSSHLFFFDTNKQWKLLCTGVLWRQQSSSKNLTAEALPLASHAACQLQTLGRHREALKHLIRDTSHSGYVGRSDWIACNAALNTLKIEI